eukprot:gb/GECG01000057.1/.p1 GENE.gb/GECG01000057.1/~~gb/GECG01000057.1/.p1  ORF type:complete len:911 (+),score=113.81 gb/GECG01000057.1/:1-2733(+)
MPVAYSAHAASVASASQRFLTQGSQEEGVYCHRDKLREHVASQYAGDSQARLLEHQESVQDRQKQLEREKQVYDAAIEMSKSSAVKELVQELHQNTLRCFILTDPTLEGLPIVYASPGFLEMTAYSQEEVLGRNCRFLQGAATDFLTARRIGDAIGNKKEYTVQILNYKKDGTPFWNLLHLAPVTRPDNEENENVEERYFYVGIQTNVTVPKKLQPKKSDREEDMQKTGSSYVAKHGFTAFLPASLHSTISDDTSKVGSSLSKFSTFRQGLKNGVTFEATNLSYSIPGPKKEDKVAKILDDISVYAKPGEMLAIMGPSGSGKTTLLNALAGRASNSLTLEDPSFDHSKATSKPVLSGSITLNGKPRKKDDKRRLAYVMQDDVLFDNLTVEETLYYSAKLKMPESTPEETIQQRVEEVISLLKLDKCRQTIIGSPMQRGVSGGERKRVNIGNEIVTDPSVLLLDEPTSGLDSSNALRLLSSLAMLAAAGRTVMTTIHQPSTQIFNCFDKLLLLGEGNVLYFGTASDALHYFASPPLKQVCPPHWNPADFLLEVSSYGKIVADAAEQWTKQQQQLDYVAKHCGHDVFDLPGDEEMNGSTDDNVGETGEVVLKIQNHGGEKGKENAEASNEKWPTSFLTQLSVLMRRSFKQGRGSTMTSYYLGQTIAITLVTSLLWWQIDDNASTISDREGFVFFASVYWGFNPLFNALTTFPAERSVLTRERAGGMYRLSAYFLAKSCADIPLVFTYPTIFAVVAYWAVGLRAEAGSFFTFLFGLYVNGLAAQALGLAVSSWVLDFRKSLVVAVVLMLSFMLAGGFYIQDIPVFINWYAALGFVSYTYPLMIQNEFSDREFDCVQGENVAFTGCPVTGEDVVDRLNPFLREIGPNFGILFIMAFVFRFIAYWGLRYRTKSTA